MTRITSTRYGISYVDPTLRDEPADVPGDIALLVAALENSAMFGQGTLGARPAAAKQGKLYYATDVTQLYWDTGSTWIIIGPPTTDSITAVQIAANAVGSSELADGAVDTPSIQNGAVTGAKIGTNTIDASHIAPDAVGSSELANDAVDTVAIQTGAVTGPKIPADAIAATHIQADAVGTSEIAPNSVGTSELADNAVDTAAIQNLAVTQDKIAPIAGLILARRNSAQGISLNAWTDVTWDTLVASEGAFFWNTSNAFDLLATGWHSIIASVAFDTPGAVAIRLLHVGTGQIVADNGPFSTAGLAARINLSFRKALAPSEYILQVFNSAGGAITLYGDLPILTARVDH